MLRFGVLLLILIKICGAARILAIVPTPSYSHQIAFQPIFIELAKRGHDVVFITTDPLNDPSLPNLKEIDWSFSYTIWKKKFNKIMENSNNLLMSMKLTYEMMDEMITQQLEHPEVTALINNKTEHFDLVMLEYIAITAYAFKHRFNCPLIAMSSMDALMSGHLAVGNAVHQVLYPESMVTFKEDMNFFQRLFSFFMAHSFNLFMNHFFVNNENYRVAKYFGEGYPHLKELQNSVDMLFINVNPIFRNIRPVTPATIMIGGGIHIKEPKPIPKNIKTFLDSAEVIYFSLGSNVNSVDIPLETREAILKVFSELPYNVLWKFESDDMPNKPSNVMIQKWTPQQDVLRHPNIKLFITQAGLQSLEEALFSHVPVVVMPFYGDQEGNAQKIVDNGLGVFINHKTLTADQFKNAILEVISNPIYKSKAIELATRARDEPMNELEKAVWWTEYVLRNKGAQHLKGPGLNLPLYQYYYLDIIAFVSCVFLFIIALFYFIIKKTISLLFKLVCTKKEKIQ